MTRHFARGGAPIKWIAREGWNGKSHIIAGTRAGCLETFCRLSAWTNIPVAGPTKQKPACRGCLEAFAFPGPFYVYTLDGADGVLYVGCTSAPPMRMRWHAKRPYWQDVTSTSLTVYGNAKAASSAELRLIEFLRPPLNKLSAPPYPTVEYVFVTPPPALVPA